MGLCTSYLHVYAVWLKQEKTSSEKKNIFIYALQFFVSLTFCTYLKRLTSVSGLTELFSGSVKILYKLYMYFYSYAYKYMSMYFASCVVFFFLPSFGQQDLNSGQFLMNLITHTHKKSPLVTSTKMFVKLFKQKFTCKLPLKDYSVKIWDCLCNRFTKTTNMFEVFLFTLWIWGVPLLAHRFIKNLGFFVLSINVTWTSRQWTSVHTSPSNNSILFWFRWWHTKAELTCPWDIGWKCENILHTWFRQFWFCLREINLIF